MQISRRFGILTEACNSQSATFSFDSESGTHSSVSPSASFGSSIKWLSLSPSGAFNERGDDSRLQAPTRFYVLRVTEKKIGKSEIAGKSDSDSLSSYQARPPTGFGSIAGSELMQ